MLNFGAWAPGAAGSNWMMMDLIGLFSPLVRPIRANGNQFHMRSLLGLRSAMHL